MERRTLPTWGNATYLRAPSPSEGEGWGGGERSEKQPNWHACSTWLELESTVQAAIHGCFWTRPPPPALPLPGGGVFLPLAGERGTIVARSRSGPARAGAGRTRCPGRRRCTSAAQ